MISPGSLLEVTPGFSSGRKGSSIFIISPNFFKNSSRRVFPVDLGVECFPQISETRRSVHTQIWQIFMA